MKLIIDISKDKYDEIMSMDWKNCRRFFDEEIRAIHDGKVLEQEPCWDAISRQELLKAISTWDKFGCDADTKLVPYNNNYVAYIHYDDVINCIKGMPSVTTQPQPNIKALGEDIRICQKSITDKKVLIGFNMAVALCNKHLAESEEKG